MRGEVMRDVEDAEQIRDVRTAEPMLRGGARPEVTAWRGEVRTAVVVGSGLNGLAAAVRLASHGLQVRVLKAAGTPGVGVRTSELTLRGLRHDVCSAVHPFRVAYP